ncbi:PspA/IM30 family protein [Acidimicrobiaceae bacterium USS-CC1]|uniref:PspA/IM30 family protein n=1 Tax=Acidiferrimicrobium australe TaxID=2664430 RepID=A0ABW9QQ77_9ACTN|nr:PspA/IM30 family protein [Acidiferrimicrobium australe]
MSSFFHRAKDIVNAKANRALDAAEKPDEMLDYSYEQMLEQITKVRKALVTVAASRKQLEMQEDQLKHSADTLTQQAQQALAVNREDLAREALSRKQVVQQQIAGMDPQHQQLVEQQDKLTATLQALQARVNQFRTQKETMKAQYAASTAVSSVDNQVAGISDTFNNSNAALQRAQDKIAAAQAHAGALDELLESGVLDDVGASHGDDIQRELDQLGATSSVDSELAALKAQAGLAAPAAPAALGSGDEAGTDSLS